MASVFDPAVRSRVEAALAEATDLVVWHRRHRGAGSTDWYLVRTLEDFDEMVSFGGPADLFVIFLQPQLALRGVVSPPVVEAVLRGQASSEEWVIGFLRNGSVKLDDARAYMPAAVEWAKEVLDEHTGDRVLAGPHPPSLSQDPEVLLDAYVPLADGTLTPGIY